MKFLLSALIALSLFGFLVPLSARADEVCDCVLIIDGKDCKTKIPVTYGFGDTVTKQSLLDRIPDSECPAPIKVAISKIVDPDGKAIIGVTKELCQLSTGSGSADGYNFSLSCGVVNQSSATPPAPQAGGGNVLGPCSSGKGQCIKLINPLLDDNVEITKILGDIIRAALGLIGSLTLLMMVWGGFQLFTAAGNPERVKKGGQTMLWAAIGVAVVFASYFIVQNFTSYLTTGEAAPISSSGT